MATGHFVAQTSSGGPALNVGSDASGTWYNSAYANNTWYNSAYANNAGIARIHRWLVGGEEAMRVNTSGNVGIGTSSPDTALHVDSGTVNNVAKFHSTDSTASIYLTDGTTTGGDTGVQGLIATGDILEVRGLNKVILATGTTDRMTIDSSGNVGIGTSTPSSELEISATTTPILTFERQDSTFGNGFVRSVGNTGTVNAEIGFGGGSNSHLTFDTNGSERMKINSSGNVGIGTSSPYTLLELSSVRQPCVRNFVYSNDFLSNNDFPQPKWRRGVY
jgi:hypothetical protein